MNFLKSKKFLCFFLFVCLLIDFFIIPNLGIICRQHQGYGFSYSTGERAERLAEIQYSGQRVAYNFKHFLLFWTQPPLSSGYNSLMEFLRLDHSALFFNIIHFFAFFIFALLLLFFWQLPTYLTVVIGLFFSIFHEYVAEGICMDPSYNDLWVNLLGTLIAVLIWEIFILFKNHRKRL